jgi:hypothetical protein
MKLTKAFLLFLKAGIEKKCSVFGWHIARKLFLRACAELGVTSWSTMMVVAKAVDQSILDNAFKENYKLTSRFEKSL